MKFLFDYLKGIAIGAGAILPGISSGVLCVIFGLYEKLINSVLNIFKDFKTNFKFLLPIGLGGVTGILLFGKILKYLFNSFPMQTKFAFIGLIIGCIPILFKKANFKKGFRLHYLLFLIIAFAISSIFFILHLLFQFVLLFCLFFLFCFQMYQKILYHIFGILFAFLCFDILFDYKSFQA